MYNYSYRTPSVSKNVLAEKSESYFLKSAKSGVFYNNYKSFVLGCLCKKYGNFVSIEKMTQGKIPKELNLWNIYPKNDKKYSFCISDLGYM